MSGICGYIFLLFFAIAYAHTHTRGTVTVDTYTFDKVRNKFDVVLARFDDKFPHGEAYDNFKKFAENVAHLKKLLLVEIPITGFGERENEQLAKEYGVKREDYPVYKLFLKGKDKPIDYSGDKTEDDLKRFLSLHTDLWFGLRGTVEELDRLAQQFVEASSNNDEQKQKSLLEKTRDHVKGLVDKKEQRSGEAYVKIMESIIKQGIDFLKREERRIQNLLQGKITKEKKEELHYRSNILLSFKPMIKETANNEDL